MPIGQVKSCSSKLFSGLVKMTLWLVHATSYSLLDRQAAKLTFFARVLRPSSGRGRAAFFHSLPLPVACGSRFLLACSAAILCALGEEDANRTSFIWKSSLRAHLLLEISSGSRGISHGIFGLSEKNHGKIQKHRSMSEIPITHRAATTAE